MATRRADRASSPMNENRLHTSLRTVCRDLTEIGAPFALVGGLAVSARTEPRFTKDLDLAVAVVDDRAAERVVQTLRSRQYRVQALVEQENTKRLATVRLVPPGEPSLVVDLLDRDSVPLAPLAQHRKAGFVATLTTGKTATIF